MDSSTVAKRIRFVAISDVFTKYLSFSGSRCLFNAQVNTMYIIFWCTNFKEFVFKFVHDTVIFELDSFCTILDEGQGCTVFQPRPFHHLGFSSWTRCDRINRFVWPKTKFAIWYLAKWCSRLAESFVKKKSCKIEKKMRILTINRGITLKLLNL